MREILTTLGSLRCRVLQEGDRPPRLGVVLCHGFGAPGDDLVPLAEALLDERPQLRADVRFLFPEAPLDLGAYGMPGARAWWNIDVGRFQRATLQGPEALRALAQDIPEGLAPARRQLLATIQGFQQATGLATGQLVLGGFSQGAMLATDLTLRLEEAPAALAIFSGTVISRSEWAQRATTRRGLEVLQTHGRGDAILPYFGAEALRELLTAAGLQVEFVPFGGPHTIHPGGLSRLGALLERKLQASRPTGPGA